MLDANGTRHALLLGQPDWPTGTNSVWDARRQALTLKPLAFQFASAPLDTTPTLDRRRGAARDRFGNWYRIGETSRSILIRSEGDDRETAFWPVPSPVAPANQGTFSSATSSVEPPTLEFAGLTVTQDHFLAVGTVDPAGILRFDLHAGGPPEHLTWPAGLAFAPFDMAPAPAGGLWILDRAHQRLWAAGRHFQLLRQDQAPVTLAAAPAAFQPTVPAPALPLPPPRTMPSGIDLASVAHAVAVEGLPDGSVLVLETDPAQRFSRVHRFHMGQPLGAPVSLSSLQDLAQNRDTFQLRATDFAFSSGRLYCVAESGNQAFAFDAVFSASQLQLTPSVMYFPMRLYSGTALVGDTTGVYYESRQRFLPLADQRRQLFETQARVETRVYDSGTPDCTWHRLLLDAVIPPGSRVSISTRTAETPAALSHVPWFPEPPLYRRAAGSEQAFAASGRCGETWELLFQQARGRYLQVQVTLQGNERDTPALRAMRLYYPRFSYLEQYLPAIYREDANSASFLDRFLANLEGLHTNLEDKIANVQALFDLRSAPPEALDWLATWFDVALDPAWDETRRRLFLSHAVEFFNWRGTIRGLEWALRLALDSCSDSRMFQGESSGSIRLVEQFRLRRNPGVVVGDPTDTSGLRSVATAGRWTPAMGGGELLKRYQQTVLAAANFPTQEPPLAAAAWNSFAIQQLGFVPAPVSQPAWTAFLTRRYGSLAALNKAYSTTAPSLAAVAPPKSLPPDGAPLNDWYQFQTIVLTRQRVAHRFTVLLPTVAGDFTGELHRRRRDLARRIVELQKPAHTVFDVKFYWQLFRVGEARVGKETAIDRPFRTVPARLGQSFVADSHLAAAHPHDVADRHVLGRDRLQRTRASWMEEQP